MSTKKKTADKPKKDELGSILSQMHLDLARELHARVKSGTSDAATLNVARQMLKDNNIKPSHSGKDREALKELADLPFPTE